MTDKRFAFPAPVAAPVAATVLAGLAIGVSACGSPYPAQNLKATVKTLAWAPTGGAASVEAASVRPAGRHAKHARDTLGYLAYVALGTANEVVAANLATARITGTIADSAGDSVAVTPGDSTVYIADTGKFDVLAYDVSTKKSKRIEVGPFPQDVSVSPDGSVLYATVTGGDTGPGGSDKVAVISTATNRVTGDIRVGDAPRQVAFSPDGSYAYVTTQYGIYVIDAASSSVVHVFRTSHHDPQGPQGIAVSADGKTLYVTYPAANSVRELNAATGATLGKTTVGAEPYAVTAAGTSLYVADTNEDEVSVVSTTTGKVTRTIAVGRLPMSVAATPDGSQVWVGNGLSGSVSVISVASGRVIATLGGRGTTTLDAAPLGIAFAKPSS
jgi:YVTN family beta-propeller protein